MKCLYKIVIESFDVRWTYAKNMDAAVEEAERLIAGRSFKHGRECVAVRREDSERTKIRRLVWGVGWEVDE